MVLSDEQLARMLGFWGSKATQSTKPLLANTKLELNYHRRRSFQRDGTYLCPVNVDWSSPDDAFQILMVWSSEQLARMLGFWGSNATQRTQPLLANTNLELNHHKKCSLDSNGWDVPVPGQGRLEFTRRRVPDFDGFVPAAAGNLFAV